MAPIPSQSSKPDAERSKVYGPIKNLFYKCRYITHYSFLFTLLLAAFHLAAPSFESLCAASFPSARRSINVWFWNTNIIYNYSHEGEKF